MGTNVKAFNKTVNKIVHDFTVEKALAFQRLVAVELFRRIVFRTPVDTGRLRGNWQMTVNYSPDEIKEPDKSFEAVTNRGISSLATLPPGSTVFITNNLDYAYYLEYTRRSKKSPEGMVEISIAEINNELQKYA
jgi:hypothetical protein